MNMTQRDRERFLEREGFIVGGTDRRTGTAQNQTVGGLTTPGTGATTTWGDPYHNVYLQREQARRYQQERQRHQHALVGGAPIVPPPPVVPYVMRAGGVRAGGGAVAVAGDDEGARAEPGMGVFGIVTGLVGHVFGAIFGRA